MNMYEPESARFWGDYSRILISGLGPYYDGREDGLMTLYRTGPFVPPLSLPKDGIVVTDKFRVILEKEFSGLQFQPVVKKKIVSLRWETWDRTLPKPKRFPAGLEPENYILKRQHSEKISEEVGLLWELIVEKCLKFNFTGNIVKGETRICHVFKQSWNGDHFMSLNHSRSIIPIFTDVAKDFLESHGAAEWIDFNKVELED